MSLIRQKGLKPGPAQVAKACSTAALASSRLLKKLMGCGVALGMWAGGCQAHVAHKAAAAGVGLGCVADGVGG